MVGSVSPGSATRMFSAIHYVTYIGIVAHILFIPLFHWLDVMPMAVFNVGSVLAWIAARKANLGGRQELAAALITFEVLTHAILAVWFLGWTSGFHYYLIPVIPFLLFNDRLDSRAIALASAGVGGIYVTLRVLMDVPNPADLDPDILLALEYANIAVPLTALAVLTYYFRVSSLAIARQMEHMAMTDALTGLANRRRAQEILAHQRARCERGGAPFAVVMGDIDGFKRINDSFGHDHGDTVLRTVSTRLAATLRAQDSVARWGGEEFLVVLPDTDRAGAATAAEKLRAAIGDAPVSLGDRTVDVTMTFGAAEIAPGTSLDDGLKSADAALYSGKALGRNRVVVVDSPAATAAAP